MLRSLFLPALAAVALTGSARADILIDDFSAPTPSTSFAIGTGPNPTIINTSLGGGLTRTLTLSVNGSNPVAANRLVGDIGEGAFNANYAFGSSGTVKVAYSYASAVNFIPNVPSGGAVGALSIVGAGDPGFAANIPLALTVTTATGNLTYNGVLPESTSGDPITLSLSSLSGTGDLSQVTGLTIDLTAGNSADLFMDSLGVTTPDAPVVPAPPAVVLALAAVPALGLVRAARRKA